MLKNVTDTSKSNHAKKNKMSKTEPKKVRFNKEDGDEAELQKMWHLYAFSVYKTTLSAIRQPSHNKYFKNANPLKRLMKNQIIIFKSR